MSMLKTTFAAALLTTMAASGFALDYIEDDNAVKIRQLQVDIALSPVQILDDTGFVLQTADSQPLIQDLLLMDVAMNTPEIGSMDLLPLGN